MKYAGFELIHGYNAGEAIPYTSFRFPRCEHGMNTVICYRDQLTPGSTFTNVDGYLTGRATTHGLPKMFLEQGLGHFDPAHHQYEVPSNMDRKGSLASLRRWTYELTNMQACLEHLAGTPGWSGSYRKEEAMTI